MSQRPRHSLHRFASALVLLAAASCATSPATSGAGAPDAGANDAGGGAASDGGRPVNPTALCAEPDMTQLYDGPLPTNPYSLAGQPADACVAAKHDASILLGCPSNTDGTPSGSQIARVEIALSLRDAGLGDDFIVTGAAVHNAWVEADALRAQLLEKGVPAERIFVDDRARHTDENIYYSDRIMAANGWQSALVVSDDPGQLTMTAVCDSNCCVALGRLTVLDFKLPSHTARVGHYARFPWAAAVSPAECTQIERPAKLMCSKLSSRLACASHFQLPP